MTTRRKNYHTNHEYYSHPETNRNRWFNYSDGIQNEDFHLDVGSNSKLKAPKIIKKNKTNKNTTDANSIGSKESQTKGGGKND